MSDDDNERSEYMFYGSPPSQQKSVGSISIGFIILVIIVLAILLPKISKNVSNFVSTMPIFKKDRLSRR